MQRGKVNARDDVAEVCVRGRDCAELLSHRFSHVHRETFAHDTFHGVVLLERADYDDRFSVRVAETRYDEQDVVGNAGDGLLQRQDPIQWK